MLKKIYRSVAKYIPAAKFGGAVIGGEKLSQTKFKEHVVNDILKKKTLSPYELEKILEEEGMVKGQLSKRKKFIRMISGGEEHKMTKKEELVHQARIKARIAAGRYSAEKIGEQPGGLAGQISRGRSGKEGALRRALVSKDNTKIGAGAIGVRGPNYKVTSQGGGGSASPQASAAANRLGGTASANITRGSSSQLGGDSGLGNHPQPPIGFNRMG